MRFSRVLAVVTLVGSWAWSIAAGSAGANSVHDARGEALRLYAEGRYQEALPYLDQVLAKKHHDLDLLNKRACIYIRMNQPQRALVDLDMATKLSPFLGNDAIEMGRMTAPDVAWSWSPPAAMVATAQLYSSAVTNRAIALMMLGRDDEALAEFRRSILIHSWQWGPRAGIASSYGGMGQIFLSRGDFSAALDAFDRAIRLNPNDPNGYLGRGEVLSAAGKLDLAVQSYNEAIRLAPNPARALGYRAGAFERVGNDEAALADYDAAIKQDPVAVTPRRLRAALLSRIGRNDAAVPDLDAAVRADPTNASALKDRGGVYNRLGEHAKALRDLDEAIRLDPRSSRAYQNRAAAYNGLGQFERAVRDCDEALRLDPKNAGALNNRGLALSALGRYERALADLNESIKLDPRQVPAFHNRGGAHLHLGLFDEAAEDYQEVLHRVPGFAPALKGLQVVRELAKRREGTSSSVRDDLAMLQEVSEEAQQHCDAGHRRRGSGDWSGAIAEYSRALELDPKNSDAYAFRGWSRGCQGDPAAEADARAWLDLKGWRDPFASYMALLGVLTARQAGHDQAASVFLDEALANSHPPAWPSPLFRYLKRTMSAVDLLAAADAPDKLTEAHTVIGLDLLHRGERNAAIEQLRWVRDHGFDASIAKDLARETLRRVEGK